jgi:hypothetical protein
MIVFAVARREEDKDLAIDGVLLKVALQCRTVNFDALDGDWFNAGNRNLRLHLGCNRWPHLPSKVSFHESIASYSSKSSLKTHSYCTEMNR